MFGMGFMEMMFIAVIAVIFLGPEKLPQAMVDMARFLKKVKSTIADTKEDLERELHLSELKQEMLSYKQQLDDITNEVKSTANDVPTMLQEEIDEINDTIKEATTMPQEALALNEDKALNAPYHDEEPSQSVTFKKKKKSKKSTKKNDDKSADQAKTEEPNSDTSLAQSETEEEYSEKKPKEA